MRILIAPDKFKGSLSAAKVAAAVAAGIRSIDPAISLDLCPLADGGEGTVDALVVATGGSLHIARVTGPRPDMTIEAMFGLLGRQDNFSRSLNTTIAEGLTAVVEMSAASGLALLEDRDRDPFRTTTFGTGELLLAAVGAGAKQIILGIGGSATIDGGIGCAQAAGLPVVLEGEGPADIREPLVGEDLARVFAIQRGRGSRLDAIPITVACDVTNPLFGPNGAARVFGPQKGATPAQIEQLDAMLRQLAERTATLDVALSPGAGAAGGLGYAMKAFFNATLRPGFDIVADATNLAARIASADVVITGEGRIDDQTFHGKTAGGVAAMCMDLGKSCVAIIGAIDPALDRAEAMRRGMKELFSLAEFSGLERALSEPEPALAELARKSIGTYLRR